MLLISTFAGRDIMIRLHKNKQVFYLHFIKPFRMRSLYHLLIFLLVISSCKKDTETNNCESTWEDDPAGKWYVGDMHVHTTGASNDTDGESYPEDVKRVAI